MRFSNSVEIELVAYYNIIINSLKNFWSLKKRLLKNVINDFS